MILQKYITYIRIIRQIDLRIQTIFIRIVLPHKDKLAVHIFIKHVWTIRNMLEILKKHVIHLNLMTRQYQTLILVTIKRYLHLYTYSNLHNNITSENFYIIYIKKNYEN